MEQILIETNQVSKHIPIPNFELIDWKLGINQTSYIKFSFDPECSDVHELRLEDWEVFNALFECGFANDYTNNDQRELLLFVDSCHTDEDKQVYFDDFWEDLSKVDFAEAILKRWYKLSLNQFMGKIKFSTGRIIEPKKQAA